MSRYITIILLCLILLPVGAYAQMPVDAAIVQVNPPFEGAELIYSSATIFAYNEYGNYRLDVRPGTVTGAPHNILSATHADAVVAALVAGDVLYVDGAGDLNRLAAGAATNILTMGAIIPAWAAPAAPGAHRLDQVLSPNNDTFWAMTANQLRLLYTNPAVADGALEIEASGAFAGDLIHVHQHTGNPAAVDLMHIEADDVDVRPLLVEAANNTVNSIETVGPILMTDGNEAVGFVIMDDGTGTGVMEWVDPATIPGTWLQTAEAPVLVNGADATVRALGAYAANIEDVVVTVSCRSVNGGIIWSALSHPTPVADMVTFYWQDIGDGNISVYIVNDSQLDILCTVSYSDLL